MSANYETPSSPARAQSADAQSDAVLLSEFSLYALRETEPARLIERAVTLTAEGLEVDFCTVLEVEPDGEAFRVATGHNWPADRVGRRIGAAQAPQSAFAVELYSRGGAASPEAPKPVVIDDLRLDERCRDTFRVRELGVVSSICAVILAAESPYGTLVAHSRALRRFEPAECEFVQALANVLSAALARSRSRAALEESEARFRSLAELSSDWYWEQDADLRFTFVSEGFFQKSSFRREEILGKRRWELFVGKPVGSSWEAHRATLEARLPFRDFEYERIEADGTKYYQAASGDPVFDAAGRFAGYRGTGRDVTERRKTHAALQESEDRYRDLVEHSQDLMCTHQLDGRIRSVNPWAAATLGYEVAELLNMSIRDVLAPKVRPEFADYIARLEKDGVASGVMLVQSRTGEKRLWKYTNSLRTKGVPAPIVRGMAHDVTEQSRAERALLEREELLRVTFDNAPDGISLHDISGNCIKANRALQAMLGFSESELRRMTLADLVHPDERSESQRTLAELIAGRKTRITFDRRYLRKDGGILSARVTTSVVHGEDGSARYTVALIEDVTEQLRVEAKLRAVRGKLAASEAQLRAFMNHSSVAMFIKDQEGRYLHVNAQFLRNFGLTADKVLGRTTAEVFASPQAEAFLNHDACVRAMRAPVMETDEVLWADGMHATLANKFPILDETGEVAAIGGVITDITERKRMEQALREQGRLLSRAQELAGLGYWEYDPRTRMTKSSLELRRMLDVDVDLPGQVSDWSLQLVDPGDRERVRAAIRSAVEQGANFELEARVITVRGKERIMVISGEGVKDAAGHVSKVIGSCFDVTEQRHRERALCDAADQLQALSRRLVEAQEMERRRLAAELHDQVGQNLTALSINLDIVAARLNALEGAGDAKRRLQDSLALVDATSLCIEGMLDELRPPMLDDWGVGPTLRGIVDDFSLRTEFAVRLEVHGTERRIDRQNELSLVRVVQEALNNVAKHAHAGRVQITLGWEPDWVRVEIADDGCGFEDNGSAGRGGLGLLSMRERMQAADGLLEVESAPGKGTRVRASVPD